MILDFFSIVLLLFSLIYYFVTLKEEKIKSEGERKWRTAKPLIKKMSEHYFMSLSC